MVQAVNAAGPSAGTAQSCVTLPTLPPAPSNVVVVADTGRSLTVTWRDNSTNENGFEVLVGTTPVTVGPNATAYRVDKVPPGTTMCFRVRAFNVAGYSAYTPSVCAATPTVPAVPGTPTVAADTGTSLKVTWADRSTNEMGFEISNGTTSNVVGPNVTTFSWGGLANGTAMCFQVRAYNLAGYSAWTPSVCGTTPTIPAPPRSPSAVAASSTSITVRWVDGSTNEIGFEISNGTTSRVVGANTVAYTWTGLPSGATSCFRVRSYSLAGYSAWTPNVCATTPIPVPAVPGSPSATPNGANSITLRWVDTSTNETGFQVTNGVSTVTLGANVTAYTWGGLAPGTYMCLAVRAFNAGGYSAYTPWACTTTLAPPPAPTGITATATSPNQIVVRWLDTSANETGFQIFDGVNTFQVGANVTSFTISNLLRGTYHCYSVRSFNAIGYSAFTPSACTSTLG
jgi:hypothetical protein